MRLYGEITALMAIVHSVKLGPIEPVGEPGDGSVPWQRVLSVDFSGGTCELTLLAEDRSVLEAL